MPNLANILKQEIARIARKEARSEVEGSQRAVTAHRKQIAELRRRIAELERELRRLRKQAVSAPAERDADNTPSRRFRPAGFKAHRERLGLSAKDVGALIGANQLSVYKWEQGKARPRAKHLEAIAQLRKMGKREALKRLRELAPAF